jgi:arylsulfatase A
MFGYLHIEEVTFGHVLKKAGYSTGIAGKWQLGNGIDGPYNAGFDEYCLWQIYRKIGGEWVVGSRYADPKIYQNGKLAKNTEGKYGPDIFCDFILDFMKRKKAGPFFVYYPMVLTHDPFVPTPDTPEWQGDKNKKDDGHFGDMVTYMDKIIGRIVKKLDELKLREKTLILFTGDNGTHRRIRSKLGDQWIQGGKREMTDAGTHVPFIANWPETIAPNRICDDLIDFSDFMPTLADVAGASLPEEITIDGRSFLQQLYGNKGNPREWIFMYYWGRGRDIMETRQCARDKRWKLYDDGSFFDVVADPLEQNPIKYEDISGETASAHQNLRNVLETMK